MSNFYITKRDKCPDCDGVGSLQQTIEYCERCDLCDAHGYIDTQVNLLDVLKKIHWGEELSQPYGNQGHVFRDRQFDNVRIEE